MFVYRVVTVEQEWFVPIVRQTQQLSGGEMHKESQSAMPVVFTSSYMGYGVEQKKNEKYCF